MKGDTLLAEAIKRIKISNGNAHWSNATERFGTSFVWVEHSRVNNEPSCILGASNGHSQNVCTVLKKIDAIKE